LFLFGKLGENEVVESADFGTNQRKNYAGLHTLRDAKGGGGMSFYREAHPYGMQRAEISLFFSD
jgi:hypothetical protein